MENMIISEAGIIMLNNMKELKQKKESSIEESKLFFKVKNKRNYFIKIYKNHISYSGKKCCYFGKRSYSLDMLSDLQFFYFTYKKDWLAAEKFLLENGYKKSKTE